MIIILTRVLITLIIMIITTIIVIMTIIMVIDCRYLGLQKTRDYHGTVEFKLGGSILKIERES